MSPDGTIAFVTGESWGIEGEIDYATFAYDVSTGAKLWLKRYDGPVSPDPTDLRYDIAYSIAVSPDGTKVFVTGESPGVGTFSDYATIAYDASTGAKLWGSRYDGPGNYYDIARSVAASPDGTTVFVTGVSPDAAGLGHYATLAYDTATGTKLWVRLHDDPHHLGESASAVIASPDGTKVFVTGTSQSSVERLRLRDARLRRIVRDQAVGEPLQRPRQRHRLGVLGRRESRRDEGLRDRIEPRFDEQRGLRDGRLRHLI